MSSDYSSTPLQYWTNEHVSLWLRDRGFNESVVADFQRGYITGPRLAQLSMVDITTPLFNGDFETRNHLVSEISSLQAGQLRIHQTSLTPPQQVGIGAHAIEMAPLSNFLDGQTSIDYTYGNINFSFSNCSGHCKMINNPLRSAIICTVVLDLIILIPIITVGIILVPFVIPAAVIPILLTSILPIAIYRNINATPDYIFDPSQITQIWRRKPPVMIPANDIQSVHCAHKEYYDDGSITHQYLIRFNLKSTSSCTEKTLEAPIIFTEEKQAAIAASLLAKTYHVELLRDASPK